MISPNELKRIMTFYNVTTVPNITSELGGNTQTYTEIGQEYGALYSLKPMEVVNNVQEEIRSSTHILTIRYRKDLDSFTAVSTMILDNDFTTRTELYSVNDIQQVDQDNRYLICHLSLQELDWTPPSGS